MLCPNEEEWNKWGIHSEIEKYFLLRLDELFDNKTFDSWRVRTSNIRSILYEMLESVDITKRFQDYHTNIDILIKESERILKNDSIFIKYFPQIRFYYKNMKQIYEGSIRQGNKANLVKIERIINIALTETKEYKLKIFEEVEEIIKNKPEKYKDKLDKLMMSLGIELRNSGYSLDYIIKSIQNLKNNSNLNFNERILNFRNNFSNKKSVYKSYFLVRWPSKYIEMDFDNYKIIERFDRDTNEINEFLMQDRDARIIEIKVEAFDEFSALNISKNKLVSLFSIRSLYSPLEIDHKIKPKILINRSNDKFKLINQDLLQSNLYTSYYNLRNARKAQEKFNDLIVLYNNLSKFSQKDANYLLSSLQYFKLSISSGTDETKIINLWIALESLFQEGNGNVISRITKYLPKVLTSNYIKLLLRAMAVSMKDIWRSNDNTVLKHLKRSNNYIFSPKDLLDILVNGDDCLMKEFLKFTSVNPLLVYRVYSIRKEMFCSNKALKTKLESHRQNIEWQLRRIYRLRNSIMHQGKIYPETSDLLRHLYSYYIVFIHDLIHVLMDNEGWNINYVLESRLNNYDYFIERIKDKGNSITKSLIYNMNNKEAREVDDFVWKDA
jgi:hypothetical protein